MRKMKRAAVMIVGVSVWEGMMRRVGERSGEG